MKYIENNKIYVQICDLNFIFIHGAGNTPKSVFDKVLNIAVNMTDDNKYDFIEFDAPLEIHYFKSLSFILDYKDIMGLSSDEVFEYLIDAQERIEHLNMLYKGVYKLADIADLNSRYKKLRYRCNTVQAVYDYKKSIEQQKDAVKVKRLKPTTLNTHNNNV